jgi:hypothetical protein
MSGIRWWCGFDWASQKHHVCLLDATGELVGERKVEHDDGTERSETFHPHFTVLQNTSTPRK